MKIKKFLALLLAGIMALGCFAVSAAADEGDSFDLFIAFGGDPADSTDWAYQYYGEGGENKGDVVAANEKIAVGETKTVSLTLPAEAATTYFIAPCLIAGADYKQMDFDVKVTIDGNDVTSQLDFEVDAGEDSRKWWYEDTGNFKGDCIRLAGGFNTYAPARSYLKEMPAFTKIEYTVTLNSISTEEPEAPTGEDESGEDEPAAAFDPSSDEYIAQMYVQVDGSWVFRNQWAEENYGGITDYQYADQLSDVQDTANPVPHDGTFTDVVLKGNGTYTLSLENPDFTNGSGTEGTKFNLIGISTNMPASAADVIKVTDMTIQVNDSAMLKYTYPEAYLDEEGLKNTGYLNVLGANSYNSDAEMADCKAIFCDAANWPGQVSKITITFTISGFDHDAPAGGGDETDAANGETKADDGATKADSSSSDKKDDSKGGLPTGAIIGIIAGVVLVVVVVVVVVTSKKKKSN
ncbi:MAG: hypothetical protein NC223_02000 [Butyrivibrio sp.]|nr:hypothetical protein [Butyrivibrio sp.]